MSGETASGVVEHQKPDALPDPASSTLQPPRLTVLSGYSSFKAASGLRPSAESVTPAQCMAEPSKHCAVAQSTHRLTAGYAIAACTHSEGAKTGCAPHAAGAVAATVVAVKAVKLSAEDVAAVCDSMAPGSDADTASGADTVVHVRVMPSTTAAHGVMSGALASQVTASGGARQSSSHAVVPATPRALQRLMDAVTAHRQVPEVAATTPQHAKEHHAGEDTADLATKTCESPAMRPSVLQHIYSNSPEQAVRQQVRDASTIEIEHGLAMSWSGSVMARGRAPSAEVSQAAAVEHAADNSAALPGSPQSDTVSIRCHSMLPGEPPLRVPTGQLSQSIADSAWLQVGAMRKGPAGSSGLMHGDSSGAWVSQNCKGGRGKRAQSLGRVQASQGLSTGSSAHSMGTPSRSYLRRDPRHTFHSPPPAQQAGALPVCNDREPAAEESEAEVSQSIPNNDKDSETTDLHVGEAGGSMMLPLPPVMSTFL